ncbi:MAG: RtcB family protein, partial [Marinicaulis sp.]|nr:RtcB family protein [Marinicaulis sp.]
IAAMPDIHFGRGAMVGSVIATKDAIMPAAVGVDIGYGMIAMRLSVTADLLPDDLAINIERTAPHGDIKCVRTFSK